MTKKLTPSQVLAHKRAVKAAQMVRYRAAVKKRKEEAQMRGEEIEAKHRPR